MEHTIGTLKRLIWSDADFEEMGWHGAYVHAIAAIPENFELMLDIDYIVQWVNPIPPEQHFKFWVAPATLVFSNVWNVKFCLESESGEFSIQGLERLNEQATLNGKMTDWLWRFLGNEGSLSFRATAYKQHFRKQPILTLSQQLMLNERDGISFNRESES